MKEQLSKNYEGDDFEPRMDKYEDGNSALVYDEPGETITIGDGDKYFRDPLFDPTAMLRFNGLRDDGTKVDVFLTGNNAAVVRTFEDERTPQAVDFLKTDIPINSNQYQVGEKAPFPVYGGNDVTLLSVSAEYKGGWGISKDAKKGASPFAQICTALELQKNK